MVEQGGVLMATIEQQRNRIIQVMYIAMILALIYLFFHYVFPIILPFVIAFLIAALCMPIVRFLAKRTRLTNKKVWGLIVIFGLYTMIVSVVTWLLFKLFGWLNQFIIELPSLYLTSILPALERMKAFSTETFARIAPEDAPKYQSLSKIGENTPTSRNVKGVAQ